MRSLVLGGNGFMGIHVVGLLVEAGTSHEVLNIGSGRGRR